MLCHLSSNLNISLVPSPITIPNQDLFSNSQLLHITKNMPEKFYGIRAVQCKLYRTTYHQCTRTFLQILSPGACHSNGSRSNSHVQSFFIRSVVDYTGRPQCDWWKMRLWSKTHLLYIEEYRWSGILGPASAMSTFSSSYCCRTNIPTLSRWP